MVPPPPSCPFTGRHIRYLLLAACLSYLTYFIVHGVITEPPSSRAVYICDTASDDDVVDDVHVLSEDLTQCLSLDDVTTCANLKNANGGVATCIESSCGYRLFPKIDISVAGSSNPYDPYAATSKSTFLAAVSIFYGLVPYLCIVYLPLFLLTGDLVPLTRLVVLGMISIINEGIIKHLIEQPRPTGSCLYFLSFGMPSGHAATSVGLLTYLLLEKFVYHPNLLFGTTCIPKSDQRSAYSFLWGYGWHKQTEGEEHCLPDEVGDSIAIDINVNITESDALVETKPLSVAERFTQPFRIEWIYHWYALGYCILLLPVPFSRVYLHDHSRNQVLVGSFVGMVTSIIWYIGVVRNCGMKMIGWRQQSEWGKWWCSQPSP